MYKRHSAELKEKVVSQRKEGRTIPELMVAFGLAKTTVWHMVKDVDVPSDLFVLIQSKRGGSAMRKSKSLQEAEANARMFLAGKDREHGSLLAMLYWAEGTKKQCSFVNTDGEMIALYLYLIKKLFSIDNDRMTFTVRTFGNLDRDTCLRYWAKITGIQEKRFIVRLNDGGTNSRRPYGMLTVSVLKGHFILKTIQALYRQIQGEILTAPSLRSSMDKNSALLTR